MGMRFREIDALLREAESRDNMTAAIKSGKAAKELRREREAVVEAAGGKKKLDRADQLLADAETVHARANAYMAEKQAEARDAEKKAAVETGRITARLGEREQKLKGRNADADASDRSLIKQTRVLGERTRLVTAREEAVLEKEAANANVKETLGSTQARLKTWEQELDARDARVRAAVA